MYDWIEPDFIEISEALQAFVGGHSLVGQLLARRGVITVDAARAFLHPDAYTPAPPTDLPDLEKAVTRLETAIRRGEKICVWGDFDVDGQTSTALLVGTLREFGADVTYHIPVRATESHGVNIPNLKLLIDAGAQVILTCDTGVSAHDAVAYANTRGVEVIVTDHHDLPETLPDAFAVVNPHLLPDGHPLVALPGVGVAYKVAEALYSRAGRSEDVLRHLDLVALGIVADVAEQVGDTRYLLQRGMEVLRHTDRVGLQALAAVAKVALARLTEEDIGFALGPRMNALGRLANANESVRLLTTDDLSSARILASQLEQLNEKRKQLCDDVFQGAEGQILQDPSLLNYGALVLANPYWEAGVVGIVASRLVEKYNRPVILLVTPEGKMAHGSARSVEGCHITKAITTQAALLEQFGGHRMAAGLSLPLENISAFRKGLSRAVLAQLGGIETRPTLQIDGYVPLSELSLDLLRDLRRLAPFGAGNPAPILATRRVKVQDNHAIGRNGAHLKLLVEDEAGHQQTVLWWRGGDETLPEGRFDLAYSLGVNTYMGASELQVVWADARPIVTPAPVSERLPSSALEITDYRHVESAAPLLDKVLQTLSVKSMEQGSLDKRQEATPVQVWAEAVSNVNGRARHILESADTLIIWTAPPGPAELRAVMARVAPRRVVLFAVDPGLDKPEVFLKHLAGLAKYALKRHDGDIQIAGLVSATAQREITVRKGLAWLEARGYFEIVEEGDGAVKLGPGAQKKRADLAEETSALRALLAETAAYRSYFKNTDAALLFR